MMKYKVKLIFKYSDVVHVEADNEKEVLKIIKEYIGLDDEITEEASDKDD